MKIQITDCNRCIFRLASGDVMEAFCAVAPSRMRLDINTSPGDYDKRIPPPADCPLRRDPVYVELG